MTVTYQAQCSVYFIQNQSTGDVKIGYSSDVRKRLSALQTSSGCALSLIRQIDGGRATEAWLHKRFAEYRGMGEWFSFHPDMMSVVAPDEIIKRAKITKRRDIMLTLRERVSECERLGDEVGLSAQQVLLTIAGRVTDEEAQSIIGLLLKGEANE